jgi:peptidoglycan/xylan/chitin deacetylase (PgdA/CDA1 family)
VGDWVERYPESVKALHDAGHEVMSHSAHHDHFSQFSTEQITADLTAASDAIEAITGVRPSLFRCPYGEYDDHVILAVRSLGLEPVQWSVERYHTSETPDTAHV